MSRPVMSSVFRSDSVDDVVQQNNERYRLDIKFNEGINREEKFANEKAVELQPLANHGIFISDRYIETHLLVLSIEADN